MKVKTLRAHRNSHGNHAIGDEYDHGRPGVDIHFGYIQEAEEQQVDRPKKSRRKKSTTTEADIAEPGDSR